MYQDQRNENNSDDVGSTEYNEIMKAKRNAEYLAMLDKSMAEAEAGGFITKTVDELGAYQ